MPVSVTLQNCKSVTGQVSVGAAWSAPLTSTPVARNCRRENLGEDGMSSVCTPFRPSASRVMAAEMVLMVRLSKCPPAGKIYQLSTAKAAVSALQTSPHMPILCLRKVYIGIFSANPSINNKSKNF